jgi:ATP-dependent DNA ligase
MLARSGAIPTRGDCTFEVKWDGFRAIVSTEGEPLRARSRRGWNMTDLVPELSALPKGKRCVGVAQSVKVELWEVRSGHMALERF